MAERRNLESDNDKKKGNARAGKQNERKKRQATDGRNMKTEN